MHEDNKMAYGAREANDSDAFSLDLRRLWQAALESRWIISVIVAVCFFMAFAYTSTMRPSYSSNILLKIEENSGVMSAAGNLGGLLQGLPLIGRRASLGSAEQALLVSRFILGRVVDKLGLDVSITPRTFPVLGRFFSRHPEDGKLTKARFGLTNYAWGGEKLVVRNMFVNSDYINQRLRLVVGRQGEYRLYSKSGQLILSGHVGMPAQSGVNASAVKLEVMDMIARPGEVFYLIKHDTGSVISALERRLKVSNGSKSRASARTGLIKIQYTGGNANRVVEFLNTYAKAAYYGGAEIEAKKAEQTLEFLDQQLPLVKENLQKAEDKLSAYQSKSGNLNMTEQFRIYLQGIATRQQALETMKLQLTQLSQKFTASHPYIVTLKGKIKEMQRVIDKLNHKLHQLPITDKGSVELLRDVKAKNQLYLALLSRRQELRVLKAGFTSNVRILSYAEEPPLLISPNKLRYLLFGLIFGLVISIAFVIIRLLLDDKIFDPMIVKEKFNLDVKATIPYSDKQVNLAEVLDATTYRESLILSQRYANDVVVESLRSLRTNLQLGALEGKKIFCISSLTPGAGKSFISTNISFLSSCLGCRVLLIDGDMRKGYLQKYMKKNIKPGLSDYLAGNAEISDIVTRYENSNLFFIPRGGSGKASAELLSSNRLEQLFSWVRKEFDMVFVDTPPILLLTDGIILARQADTNVLMLPSGKHSVRDVQAGIDLYNRNNVDLSGVVFNQVEKAKASSSSYYYYGNYYGKQYKDSGYYSDDAKPT